MKRLFVGIILTVLAIFSTGCRWGGNPQRPAPQRRQAPVKKEKPELPQEMTKMEETSLELYRSNEGEWDKERSLFAKITNDWRILRAELTAKKVKKEEFKVVDMHLAGVDEAIKQRNLFKLKEHANEIVGGLQPLKSKYKNPIPPELVELEISLRELQLHIDQGNWTIAQDIVKSAPKQWEKLKPRTKKIGAEEVGKNAEGAFKELETAVKEKNQKKAQDMITMLQSDFMDLRRALVENGK